MGAPDSGIQAGQETAGPATAEALLSAFETISAPERRRHATVYNYWLSIRGKRDFPALRDLDPLEISDAGPCSVLLQLINGGEDAEIRHIGETLKTGVEVERIADAPRPSLLACITPKLAIVAISRDALAFEDEFETAAGSTRCRVTLLPFSSTGAWVDYVYGFVTMDSDSDASDEAGETVADQPEEAPEMILDESVEMPADSVEEPSEPPAADPDPVEPEPEPEPEPSAAEPSAVSPESPGFSLMDLDPRAVAKGFFGTVVQGDPEMVTEPAADQHGEDGQGGQHVEEPMTAAPSPLHGRLDEVRAKADAARLAQLQSDAALCEGLSAAYDFALDAEDQAEDYFKIVEARGLKIKLRSPMAPVVRLAFEGLCDESTIAELEGVLAWALKANLPRGSLAQRIADEGGIAAVLDAHGGGK